MLPSKKIISLFIIFTTAACAIPQPEKREVTKKIEAELTLDSAKAPEALSEEYDPEISIAVAKKFKFNVCLKSSVSQVEIEAKDVVILKTDSETKNLQLDKNLCVQWEESISMTDRTQSKNISLKRSLEIEDKFKAPLEVNFLINPWNNETRVVDTQDVQETPEQQQMLEKMQPGSEEAVPFELGFESLQLKIEKKSANDFSVTLSGSPTLDGEALRYAKVSGQIIVNKKAMDVRGVVRDGALTLNIKSVSIPCTAGAPQVEIQLNALSKKHSIKTFHETHELKSCEDLAGTHSF